MISAQPPRGEAICIADRGRPIALLAPESRSLSPCVLFSSFLQGIAFRNLNEATIGKGIGQSSKLDLNIDLSDPGIPAAKTKLKERALSTLLYDIPGQQILETD